MLRFVSLSRSGVKIIGHNKILPFSNRSTIQNITYIIIRHYSFDAYKDSRSKHGFKKTNFFINRHGNNRSDPNSVEFNKKTLAKLVYLPNHASSSSDSDIDSPITLQKLYDENIIDRSLFLSIQRMNFPSLTPVQQRTIKPILLNNNNKYDIITRAKTGTGKTFSFLIPIFQHLINTNKLHPYMVKAVIIAPTRDLALQIETEVRKIHYHNRALSRYQCVSLVGGTNLPKSLDFMHKRRPNIVIATPGRFIDILNRVGEKFFQFVDFKVLDEADRLLEIGFKQDLEYISHTLNKLNFNGQSHIRTLLFSATLDERVQNLANNIMNKEKCLFIDTVDKNEPEAHERIEQSLVISKSFADNIFATIDHLKSKFAENGTTIGDYKAILFTPTVKFTKLISSILTKEFGDQSFPVYEFHGQVSQSRRTNLVKSFKSDSNGLLICTDVAARGMDFPNVKEVLQIGVPTELANYIHRIGRTARSGKDGKSIIFLCQNELPFIDQLKRVKNIDIINKLPYESNNETRDHLASRLQCEPFILENFSESIISLISYYRSCIKEYRFNEREILPEIARTYGLLLNESEEKLPVTRNVIDRLGLTRNPISKQMFHIIGRDQNEERFDRANIHRYEMRENRHHHSYSDMKNQYKKRYDSLRRHHSA